jgi:hypothetical protein
MNRPGFDFDKDLKLQVGGEALVHNRSHTLHGYVAGAS